MSTVTLYNFEFVANNMGIWDREWFATREEAEAARQAKIEKLGSTNDPDNLSGEYGEVSLVCFTTVELTAEGVLDFAANFAVQQ